MTDPVLEAGTAEKAKAGVHLALFGVAMVCAAYNLVAFSERKDRRLAVNALLYTAISALEVGQLARHWEAR